MILVVVVMRSTSEAKAREFLGLNLLMYPVSLLLFRGLKREEREQSEDE